MHEHSVRHAADDACCMMLPTSMQHEQFDASQFEGCAITTHSNLVSLSCRRIRLVAMINASDLRVVKAVCYCQILHLSNCFFAS